MIEIPHKDNIFGYTYQTIFVFKRMNVEFYESSTHRQFQKCLIYVNQSWTFISRKRLNLIYIKTDSYTDFYRLTKKNLRHRGTLTSTLKI